MRRILPLVALLVACGSPIGPDSDAEALMVTDSAVYRLRPIGGDDIGTTIGYAYSNRTDRAVSLPNCLGNVAPHLDKWVDGRWVRAWDSPKLDCLSPPVTIENGEVYRDEVRLAAWPSGSNIHPQFLVTPITGRYRLVWGDAVWNYDDSGPPWGDPVPLASRVSNGFYLIEP
jgi:hypothetical protein